MLDTNSDKVSLESHELQVKDKTAFVEIHCFSHKQLMLDTSCFDGESRRRIILELDPSQ